MPPAASSRSTGGPTGQLGNPDCRSVGGSGGGAVVTSSLSKEPCRRMRTVPRPPSHQMIHERHGLRFLRIGCPRGRFRAMAGTPITIAWLNGKLLSPLPTGLEELSVDMLKSGRGCYTTALIRDGSPVWRDRHGKRLQRDAKALGLGAVELSKVDTAFDELASAAFGSGSGIVRVTVYPDNGGALNLLAEARDLSGDPDQWRAILCRDSLDASAAVWTGAKGSNFAFYDRVRETMAEASVEEVLLHDPDGYVIEGCRSNIFLVDVEGRLVAPNISRGAVAGLAQECVHEFVPEVVVRDMPLAELADVQEIIAVNSVRHASPIVELDGKPVGTGKPGKWFRTLQQILSSLD